MRAVDTNVLVRLIVQDDPRQLARARAFVSAGAWVPLVALAEAAWVLKATYRRDSGQIAAAIEMLLDQEQVVLEDADTVTAAVKLFREHPRLGFADCLVVEAARRAGQTPLGTFDRDLARLPDVKQL